MELLIVSTQEGSVNHALSQALGKRVHTDKLPSGAPYIRDDPHYLSLSHKGRKMVVAISDRPVGIDIERVEERDVYYRIAHNYFGETIAEGDIEAFFRGWTRREAFGKMLGVGLTKQIMALDMSAPTLQHEGNTVYFVEKRTSDGYMITVAAYYEDCEMIYIGE